HVLRGVEVAHLAGDAGGERRRVEIGDRADAAAAARDVRPRRRDIIADGADDAETCDDDTTLAHLEFACAGIRCPGGSRTGHPCPYCALESKTAPRGAVSRSNMNRKRQALTCALT